MGRTMILLLGIGAAVAGGLTQKTSVDLDVADMMDKEFNKQKLQGLPGARPGRMPYLENMFGDAIIMGSKGIKHCSCDALCNMYSDCCKGELNELDCDKGKFVDPIMHKSRVRDLANLFNGQTQGSLDGDPTLTQLRKGVTSHFDCSWMCKEMGYDQCKSFDYSSFQQYCYLNNEQMALDESDNSNSHYYVHYERRDPCVYVTCGADEITAQGLLPVCFFEKKGECKDVGKESGVCEYPDSFHPDCPSKNNNEVVEGRL